jgi:ABC-type multidrug transport system fused ATPase/permease subunit
MNIISNIKDIFGHWRFAEFTSKTAFKMISLSLVSTVMEVFGLAIFLPIFQFIRFNGNIDSLVAESSIWKYIIDISSSIGIEVSLSLLLLMAFSFLLFRQLFTYFRILYFATVSAYFNKKLKDKMFNAYMLANSEYHDSTPVGRIVNVMTTEVRSAVGVIISPMEILVNLIIIISYLFVLLALSFEMTIASMLILLFASRIPGTWFKKSAEVGRSFVKTNTELSSFLVERLKSPRLVHLSGTLEAEKNEFYGLTHRQKSQSIMASKLKGRTDVTLEPTIIGFSLCFLYISYSFLDMKIEEIGLYLIIILRLTPITKGVLMIWQSIQSSIGSIESIEGRFHSMNRSKEIDEGVARIKDFNNKIEFIDASYRYPISNKNSLENINIDIKKGSMTAIVGPSGGGKSTLVDLLSRLRNVSTGDILIDGVSLNDFSLKDLREFISYTPQDPQLFCGTIYDHICYGRTNATYSEVVEAAKISGSSEFIDLLPEKYESLIDENAINLSGGQRQRLDLARALLKKSFLLILDEPTSNLDAGSTEIFNKSLKNIRDKKNTTIIIISHDLQSIASADNIIVLNNGKVESTGSHDNLLLLDDGWYAKHWNK